MQARNMGIKDLSFYCYERGLDYSIEMEIEKLIKGAA
jgi:hypothetical protein